MIFCLKFQVCVVVAPLFLMLMLNIGLYPVETCSVVFCTVCNV